MLGNKGEKIDQRRTTTQVGLPTSTVGIQPSRLTQSISAIDITIMACTQAFGPPSYAHVHCSAQLSLSNTKIHLHCKHSYIALNYCEPDLPGLTNHSDSGKDPYVYYKWCPSFTFWPQQRPEGGRFPKRNYHCPLSFTRLSMPNNPWYKARRWTLKASIASVPGDANAS